MAIFDAIKTLGGADGGGLAGALQDLVSNPQTGGLGGLLDTLKGAGLGDVVNGWVSTGPNPGISGDQLSNSLGLDQLSGLATRFGLPVDQLIDGVAQALPGLVDRLTPEGRLPDAGQLDGLLKGGLGDVLGGLLGRR